MHTYIYIVRRFVLEKSPLDNPCNSKGVYFLCERSISQTHRCHTIIPPRSLCAFRFTYYYLRMASKTTTLQYSFTESNLSRCIHIYKYIHWTQQIYIIRYSVPTSYIGSITSSSVYYNDAMNIVRVYVTIEPHSN